MVRLGRSRRSPSLLSVVVPAYDVAAYLPACLDSVLAQADTLGRTGLEVVIVDDGSPDDVGAIADSYAARDPRVRAVHIDNRGLGAARNEGLRHVTGDLLAFADSDDVVPPGSRVPGADVAPPRTRRTLVPPPHGPRFFHVLWVCAGQRAPSRVLTRSGMLCAGRPR
jgi:hypothetical protein